MEYIQCPHCQKKYGVNDKLRASVGKRIRCKHCQETFAIFIQEAIDKAAQQRIDSLQQEKEPEAKPEAAANENDGESAEKKASAKNGKDKKEKPKKRRKRAKGEKKPLNIQLLVMIILAVLLVVAATATYLFYFNPEIFGKPSATGKKETVAPEFSFKPIDPFAKPPVTNQAKKRPPEPQAQPATAPATAPINEPETAEQPLPAASNESVAKDEAASEKKEARPATPPPPAEKKPGMLDGPENPSQVCKDAAADYWIRTHMISNAKLTNEAYLKLLNQGLSQTQEVRMRCKDRTLVGRLSQSARLEEVPDWIRAEIIARTSDESSEESTPAEEAIAPEE